MKHEP